MGNSEFSLPRHARRPGRWLRILVPSLLIVGWVAIAGVGGPYFGRVAEVSSNEPTTYLPASADATRVQAMLADFSDSSSVPAIAVFTSEQALSPDQMEAIEASLDEVSRINGVGPAISPLIPSADGMAGQAFIPISSEADIGHVAANLSDSLRSSVPSEVQVFVTGPAGFTSDLLSAFSGIDGILLGVALAAVLIILVLVYRSLLLPIAVLSTSVFALAGALLTVWWLAKWEVLMLNGQTQGILFILVIGAATDYSLLYVARYRGELQVTNDKWVATSAALRGSVEPIVASGSTVIAGLLCLLLSDLKSNSALGPVASVGILFAIASALTLLPAILFVLGRHAFWPREPRYEPIAVAAGDAFPRKSIWTKLSDLIASRPRTIWIGTTVVLAVAAIGVAQLNADGVPQSDLVLGASEAREGQDALGQHFPGGSGSPVLVAVGQQEVAPAVLVLQSHPDIEGISITSADSPSGSAPITTEGITPVGPPGTPIPEPTVVDQMVLLQATLTSAADSAAAGATVEELRADFESRAPSAIVGGVTATALDTNHASIHDRNLIIPLVLLVITLILMVLLRAVVAPILLIATTVLSFGSAMGISALLFNHVFRFPGADPAVPLYGFIFLVALGIDYNIFLMTRVREESVIHGTRPGILRGLAITGGVITSAGLVLAATFASLGVIPILFLVQLAVIVSLGVLLDTFVVRTLLVPALTYDIGAPIWWPSALARSKRTAEKVPR